MNDKLTFYNLFKGKSISFYLFLGAMGIIDSIWGMCLLFLINNKIAGTPLPFFNDYDWQIYLLLLVISFAVSAYFQTYIFKLTYNFGKEMALSIFQRLRFASLESYQELGEERVRTALEDVNLLETFPSLFLTFFKSAVMVLIGSIYLFWIDIAGSLLVIGTLVLLMFLYILRNVKIEKVMEEARTLNDLYMKNVYDFLGGFKQVKMSTKRSNNLFYNFLSVNRTKYTELQLNAMLKALGNELAASYSFYIIIGLILFALPALFNTSLQTNTAFLTTLLFIMGPIGAVVGLMKTFVMVAVSINRLNDFNEVVSSAVEAEETQANSTNINPYFESIRFDNVSYQYKNKANEGTFALKPLHLHMKRGEVIFVTGGNGSGKSTFINLLSGLLIPGTGQIFINEFPVSQENICFYRNQIASVFSDNFLFNENYDEFDFSKLNSKFGHLLERMALKDVIQVDSINNKLLHNLSHGQKKRVALIYAILEDKDVFVFDEWAAEQDPEFRRRFYYEIMPDLKQMGKTIIAVTHDDAYFHCAERIIRFDYGQLVEDQIVSPLKS